MFAFQRRLVHGGITCLGRLQGKEGSVEHSTQKEVKVDRKASDSMMPRRQMQRNTMTVSGDFSG
jgi:hypothetical protein